MNQKKRNGLKWIKMGKNEDRLKIEIVSSKGETKKGKRMERKRIWRKGKGKKCQGRKLRIDENGKGRKEKVKTMFEERNKVRECGRGNMVEKEHKGLL